MYSVHDRVIVDNMSEFEHSSSRAGCTFSMQDSRVQTRKKARTTGHNTQQARLPADYGLYNSTLPSLVNCILTIPEYRNDHHGTHHRPGPDKASALLSSSRIHGLLKKVCANSPLDVSQFRNFPIACCSCFALALALLIALFIAVMIRSSASKLVHRSLVSLSLCIRLDVHDH